MVQKKTAEAAAAVGWLVKVAANAHSSRALKAAGTCERAPNSDAARAAGV